MIDLITHCADTAALAGACPEGVLPHAKTPTVHGTGETLALVRVQSEEELAQLQALPCLHILGSYEEVFADPEKKAIYDRIYPREPILLENGGEYIPPERFGVFA